MKDKVYFLNVESVFGEGYETVVSQVGPPLDRKEFQKLIPKCALHSTAVQTLHEVMTFNDNLVFKKMPIVHLLNVIECFHKSYRFSHVFNESQGLRQALQRMGYMNQVPNLLKIETLSAQSHLSLLTKIYSGQEPDHKAHIEEIEKRLIS